MIGTIVIGSLFAGAILWVIMLSRRKNPYRGDPDLKFTAPVFFKDGSGVYHEVVGSKATYYGMGPGEVGWWRRYSIPTTIAVLLLFVLLFKLGGVFGQPTPTSTTAPVPATMTQTAPATLQAVVVSPVVVTTPAPQVSVNVPQTAEPTDPKANMTPEERRQYEIWVERK